MTDYSHILEKDLIWREAELVSLKRLAIVNTSNVVILTALLRGCWALLYAHFEGFTKFCWDLLLDQVQSENVDIGDLSEEFKLLALEKSLRSIRGNNASKSLWTFFNSILPGALRQKAFFPADCRLDTESNLWPNIFERECARVGINPNELNSCRPRIKTLVSRRNDIAHGKSMTIMSVDEYSEYENATFLVLHDLAVQVLDIIEQRKYKQQV